METFTVQHLAVNGIAPVDKLITYGIIDIAATPHIQWCSQNLGAERVPLKLDDITDASRGWFFQFNRKKGYLFNGTTRIPDTPPDKWIIENCDWTPENNPCVELGAGWRLPTAAEWNAMRDGIGVGKSQSRYYANSPLKLHQPGWFYTYSRNALYSQGLNGKFWTSQKGNAFPDETSQYFNFMSSNVSMAWMKKIYGASIRAVRDI